MVVYMENEFDLDEDFNETWNEEEIEDDIQELKGNLKKFSKQKHKVKEIRNGAIVYQPSKAGDSSQSKHTPESKRRIAEAIKSRPKNARAGTSKKAQTFKQQLIKDYDGIKVTNKNRKEILEWFQKNLDKLDIDNDNCVKELGIITEYQQQKFFFDEFGVDEILYSNDSNQMNEFEDDLIEVMDYERLEQELNESIIWLKEHLYSDEYIEEYVSNFWLDNGYKLDSEGKVIF